METEKANLAEIRLSYCNKVKATEREEIKKSPDAVKVLRSSWNEDEIELREEFKIMLLNRAHKVLGICTISQGGVSCTLVDPKLVFACALKANACSIILAHNHPSGNQYPSDGDKTLTHRLLSGGKLLDITVLDHIILTRDFYYSFADNNLI